MIWYHMISYHTISYHMIWYHMTWYHIIWYDIISYEIIWYDIRPRPRPQPLFTLEIWNFFQKNDLGKLTLRNRTYAKKIRAKILYIFHIETLQDIFSRTNFDYFLFAAYKLYFSWGTVKKIVFLTKKSNCP